MVALWRANHIPSGLYGNTKSGIHCEFTPGQENLAYSVIREGEQRFPNVWALPWPDLVALFMNRLSSLRDTQTTGATV
ncbi:MAG: hypothetical protein ACYCQM_13565 [Acidithiobacillus sp.]